MLWFGIIAGVIVTGAAAYFFLFDRRSPVEVMEQEDGADTTKRWARACYSMVFGKQDPARNGQSGCKMMLRSDWEISDAAAVSSALSELNNVPSGNAAWDLVRAIIIARLAAGAGYLEDAESWKKIAALKDKLTQSYSGWDALTKDYADARKKWFDTRKEYDEDEDDQLEMFRGEADALRKVVLFK